MFTSQTKPRCIEIFWIIFGFESNIWNFPFNEKYLKPTSILVELFGNAIGMLSSTRSPVSVTKNSWDDVARAQARDDIAQAWTWDYVEHVDLHFQHYFREEKVGSKFSKLRPPLADQTFPYKIIQFANFVEISLETKPINEGSANRFFLSWNRTPSRFVHKI